MRISEEDLQKYLDEGAIQLVLNGREEFQTFDPDGIPGEWMVKAYYRNASELSTGSAGLCIRTRRLAQAERDACEMRSSDGSIRAQTYGEYRKAQAA